MHFGLRGSTDPVTAVRTGPRHARWPRSTAPPLQRNESPNNRLQWWAAVDDCEPRINTMGLGADHVGRKLRRASMMVGQDGCSIASRASNECEPLHLAGYILHIKSASWPVLVTKVEEAMRV
jgi:hypothetical protein